jgi:bacteriochlorophyll 4-vinyl reductase
MLAVPPAGMVPEATVTALQQALTRRFGPARAAALSWIAVRRTADYLLQHPNPVPVHAALKWLPTRAGKSCTIEASAGNGAGAFDRFGRLQT